MEVIRKWLTCLLSVFLFVLLAACSGSSSDTSSKSSSESKAVKPYAAQDSSNSKASAADSGTPKKNETKDAPNPTNDRMIIYNAELSVTVKDFNKAERSIQTLIDKANGYTIQSDVSKDVDGGHGGTIVARIPQPHFDSFIDEVSKVVYKVDNQHISGEDVTKEYVDLKSRLQAKEAVEARLNTFLKQAKDTDDLLKISDDLARVQEEIESIKGQMNYLKNHSDLSTVTITLSEKSVKIKDKKDLNTWDKTKNAFIGSINAIVTFFSGVFIFLVGYSPILIALIIIAGVIYYVLRRRKRKE